MFGSCAGKAESFVEVEENARRPKRYEGQKRDLVVKQAARVAHHTLVADISEIEKKLSDDEREYEAKGMERQEERRRKEEDLHLAARQNVVAEASGQGLAKIHETAKSAMKLELGQLVKAGKGGKGTSTGGESFASAAIDDLKMSMPEAPVVVVKVAHPCYVSVLRAKLHRSLGIPLEHVRLVHRCKALKDNDLVPDDSVDDGEQDQVEEVLGGGGLDLSYLWLLDARNLEPRTPNATSPTGDPSGPAAKKQDSPSSTISTATQRKKRHKLEDQERSGDGCDDWVETIQGVGRDATHTKGDSKSTGGRESARESEAADVKDDDGEGQSQHLSLEVEPDGENTPPAENLTDEKAKENTREKREHGDAAGGVGDDGPQADKLQKAKKKRGRLVPGSVVLTALAASDMPNTEKGVFSKQDPYLVVKWGDQEVRTSARRDSGKDCSWPKEELALIVRTKKQLQEPVQVEVWNDNAGDKKPSPDVVIGKGNIPMERLARLNVPAAPSSTIGAGGKSGISAAGETAEMLRGRREKRRGDGYTDDEGGSEGLLVTVDLVPSEKKRRRKKTNVSAGTVTLTLEYTPPRRKPPKATKEEQLAAAALAEGKARGGDDDRTATDTDDDNLSSIAGLSALSSKAKRNQLSVQELGAAMSQALEGFDIREELRKIDCLDYAQGIINEGFGQRGAFAEIQEEHLIRHPIYVPRGARKRIMALAGLIRLQMKAEKDKATKAMEAITKDGALEGAFEGSYTVDGVAFFDTIAAMNASLEEDRVKAELMAANELTAKEEEELPSRPKSPKPRSAAKEKIIRAIEARAEEEERGIYRPDNVASVAGVNKHEGGGRNSCGGGGDDGGWAKEICCEKHASQLERSAVHRREERVRETSSKINVWLDNADRFKNGAIPREAVETVMRDALLLNGLPSPRESDARTTLQRASVDDQGLQFDRRRLGTELEHLIRKELT